MPLEEENGVVGDGGIEVVKSCILFVCYDEVNVDNVAHFAFGVVEVEVTCLQGRARQRVEVVEEPRTLPYDSKITNKPKSRL